MDNRLTRPRRKHAFKRRKRRWLRIGIRNCLNMLPDWMCTFEAKEVRERIQPVSWSDVDRFMRRREARRTPWYARREVW